MIRMRKHRGRFEMKRVWMFLVLVWIAKSFFTIGQVTEFLNTLPEESAKTAKVFSSHTAPMSNYTVVYAVVK